MKTPPEPGGDAATSIARRDASGSDAALDSRIADASASRSYTLTDIISLPIGSAPHSRAAWCAGPDRERLDSSARLTRAERTGLGIAAVPDMKQETLVTL